MSEFTNTAATPSAPAAAPAAPAVQPAAAPPTAPEAQPQSPAVQPAATVREARQRALAGIPIRDVGGTPAQPSAPEAAPEGGAPLPGTPDALGRLHGEDGRFVSPDPAAVAAPGTPSTPDPNAPPPPPAAPEGFVMIELPQDHPLRDRGLAAIPVPSQHEQELRSLLNNPVRVAEVQAAQSRAAQAEAALAHAHARYDALAERFQQTLANPQLLASIHDAGTYDPLYAEALVNYQLQQAGAAAGQAGEQAAAEVGFRQQAAGAIVSGLENLLATRYTAWGGDIPEAAALAFGQHWRNHERAAGRPLIPSTTDLAAFFDHYYVRDPRYAAEHQQRTAAQQPVDREALAAEIRAQVLAELNAERERAEAASAANPMGRMPAVAAVRTPGAEGRRETPREIRARLKRGEISVAPAGP